MSDVTTKRNELNYIPLAMISENPDALRSVNLESEEFSELIESIKVHGVLKPILVREAKDANGVMKYELVDGLHRYTAAGRAGLTEIPAQISHLTREQVWEQQIVANHNKVETRPVEYTRGILRILGSNPTMTKTELCKRLACNAEWLEGRLSLLKLTTDLQKKLDDGKLGLMAAVQLAKLPITEQPDWADKAQDLPFEQFGSLVTQRVAEIREAAREGRKANPVGFVAPEYMRKLTDIKAELTKPTNTLALLAGCKTDEDRVKALLTWMLHLDAASVAAAKKKYDDDKKKKEDEKKRKEEERKAKEAEENKSAAQRAKEALAAAKTPAAAAAK